MNRIMTVMSLIACTLCTAFAQLDANKPIYMQCEAIMGIDGKPILTFSPAKEHSAFRLKKTVYILMVEYTDRTEILRAYREFVTATNSPTGYGAVSFHKFTGVFGDIQSVELTAKPSYSKDFVSRFTGKTRKPRDDDHRNSDALTSPQYCTPLIIKCMKQRA